MNALSRWCRNNRHLTEAAVWLCPSYFFAATHEIRVTSWMHGDPAWRGCVILPNLSKSCLEQGTAARIAEPIFCSRLGDSVSVLSLSRMYTHGRKQAKKVSATCILSTSPPHIWLWNPAFLCYFHKMYFCLLSLSLEISYITLIFIIQKAWSLMSLFSFLNLHFS